MSPTTLKCPPSTTFTPLCLPTTPGSLVLLFSFLFFVKVPLTSPYQVDICCTIASSNVSARIIKTNCELQRVSSDRKQHTSHKTHCTHINICLQVTYRYEQKSNIGFPRSTWEASSSPQAILRYLSVFCYYD